MQPRYTHTHVPGQVMLGPGIYGGDMGLGARFLHPAHLLPNPMARQVNCGPGLYLHPTSHPHHSLANRPSLRPGSEWAEAGVVLVFG